MTGRRVPAFRSRWLLQLAVLFVRRPDLRGMSSTADYLDECWRWSA